ATLGARQGDRVVIQASGPDAGEALAALASLIESQFGEAEAEVEAIAEPVVRAGAADAVTGIPASPGVAAGPVLKYEPVLPDVAASEVDDPEAEWQRFQEAIAASREEIERLRRQTAAQAGASEAAIFEAHALFLEDPALLDRVREQILGERLNAAAAWQAAVEEMAARFRAIDDDYMRARAADVLDVGRRVLGHLTSVSLAMPEFREPSILIAGDLSPSDTAEMDADMVLGIITERGGAMAHSAILARAFGIPAVVGAGPLLSQVVDGQMAGLDGSSGEIWLAPDEERLATLREQQREWQERQRRAREAGQQPGRTADGHRVEVVANIGSPRDVPTALAFGAEGVGLFRTEFLFLNRETAPTEEEQYQAYRAAADAL